MTSRCTFFLLLVLLALAVAGCGMQPPVPQDVDLEYTLETAMLEGSMVFVGVGDDIDGVVNPDLKVNSGQSVRVVLINGDGISHDFAIPDLNVQTPLVVTKGQATAATFQAGESGVFDYYCAVSGHRQMGMEGKLIILEP
jgi:nitrite reductase (NO-forming)